ncbi:MAG: ECF transporter S component [Agrococcus casei]|uniref:ECF transporter S component n=1 Tax=Agrococcus casei TaxID=343512 RepID=UPI003F90CA1B
MFTTRNLVIAAAVGAACSMLFALITYLEVTIQLTLPILYVGFLGIYIFIPLLGLALFRLPLAGVIVAAIAGLVGATFTPFGPLLIPFALIYAAVCEVFFVIGRYRRWQWWRFVLAGVVVGVATAFSTNYFYSLDGGGRWSEAGQAIPVGYGTILLFASSIFGHILLALAAWAIAGALHRMGLVRPRTPVAVQQ